MKKQVLILCAATSIILWSCNNNQMFSDVKNLSEYENTIFLPTLEHSLDSHKNAVYCVTLLYAWDEVRKQIKLPLQIPENYKDLLLLNNSKSYINALKENEYTATGKVDGLLISAKAEFKKSLPLEVKLNKYDNNLIFDGEKVLSFGLKGYDDYELLKAIRILYYKNDNNFILKLFPKDKEHEIILFKSEKTFDSFTEMNEKITQLVSLGKTERKNEKQSWKYYYNYEDEVVIPVVNFNIETDYSTLEGNKFNAKNQKYEILTAWQQTAFLLNEKGAEIESEAVFDLACEELEEEEEEEVQIHPKKMIFDKPFFILLKRTDAQNPYFCLWVANSELMEKE